MYRVGGCARTRPGMSITLCVQVRAHEVRSNTDYAETAWLPSETCSATEHVSAAVDAPPAAGSARRVTFSSKGFGLKVLPRTSSRILGPLPIELQQLYPAGVLVFSTTRRICSGL